MVGIYSYSKENSKVPCSVQIEFIRKNYQNTAEDYKTISYKSPTCGWTKRLFNHPSLGVWGKEIFNVTQVRTHCLPFLLQQCETK
jgi:hypothetical protein